MASSDRVQNILAGATEIPRDQRPAYLDAACLNDSTLRAEVESLLKSHDDAGSFLSSPTANFIPGSSAAMPPSSYATPTLPNTRDLSSSELEGQMIGRYKLLQSIGEGGFGVVWMAEQREPVKRRVALKIIKLGMDTRQVIARFEQERQALAMMDHPHIAKVLDAGATETGRPYFVMELVKGDPIVDYCDKNALSIDDRLDLFAQVCNAIQHAHSKGIIHRDIKPSNILVSTQDGKPSAKVIDFGIAKATSAELTSKTLFTEHRQFIGTPEYMSPEQASGHLDIDTRSDIYSLGVLLYELLTGTTPFGGNELRSAAYGEIQRIIREVDPPKPSTRLSANTNTIANVAAQRHTEPKRLGTIVRGELDWIVMKALEKDRQRRYETANGLAMDIRRYLASEPVVAAPPSTTYRFQKFVRRNRGTAIATAVVACSLLTATAVSVSFAISESKQRALTETQRALAESQRVIAESQRAEAETQRAEALRQKSLAEANAAAELIARNRAEAINKFVTEALRSSDPLQTGNQNTTIVLAMDNAIKSLNAGAFKDDPKTAADLKDIIGHILKNNGKYTLAEPLLQQALSLREQHFKSDHADTALSLSNLAQLYIAQNKYELAEPLLVRSLAMFEKTKGLEHADTAALHNSLGTLYHLQDKYDLAETSHKRALVIREKILAPTHRDLALTLNDLALDYYAQGRLDLAQPFLTRALSIYEQTLGPNHPDVAATLNSLALVYEDQNQSDLAEPLYSRALAICEKSLGPDHPLVATSLENLAGFYRRTKKYDLAVPLYLRALAIREKVFGPTHRDVAITLNNLALTYKLQSNFTLAEPLYRRTVAIDEKNFGPDHPDVAFDLVNLSSLLEELNQLPEAEQLLERALVIREKTIPPNHPDIGVTLNNLALLYNRRGKPAPAEPLAKRAVALYRAATPPNNSNIATVTVNLARIQQNLGKTTEARQNFDLAIASERLASPNGSPLLARTLWRSASAHLANNNPHAAVAELQQAVALAQKLLPPGNAQRKDYEAALAQATLAASTQPSPPSPPAPPTPPSPN